MNDAETLTPTTTAVQDAAKTALDGINQLRPKTWAVVGGRIEEYADIAREYGLRAARAAIQTTYGDETVAVYAGLKLFLAEGFNAYYGIGGSR